MKLGNQIQNGTQFRYLFSSERCKHDTMIKKIQSSHKLYFYFHWHVLNQGAESVANILGINTFKYHVSCTDGKIAVRIIYYYLFFHRLPTHKLCFLSCRPFVVNATFSTSVVVSPVSWVGQLTVNCPSQETEETS